jgi:drug/metabolite transporter (DMT)-like permease
MKTNIAFGVVTYSFLSGLLACLVSISIKLAFNTDIVVLFETRNAGIDWIIKLSLQIGFVGIAFALNSLMWLFYAKSLQLSTSTLFSTALNKLSNFVTSVFFGYLLFNERVNLVRWLFGLLLLLIGIVLLDEQHGGKKPKRE